MKFDEIYASYFPTLQENLNPGSSEFTPDPEEEEEGNTHEKRHTLVFRHFMNC
jgi:hypothetical protein